MKKQPKKTSGSGSTPKKELECASVHAIDCPIGKIVKIIGSKWTMRILHNLTAGEKRFGEIMKELPGISPRTLSARLSALEKNKIVKKKSFPVVPPHTEYSLTERGHDLKQVFHELHNWYKKIEPTKK